MIDRKTKRIILLASILLSLAACTGNINNNTPLLWITQLQSTSPGETQGDQQSLHPQVTPDGRYIVFASDATNLLNISPTPPARQIYRKDLITREIILISEKFGGGYCTQTSDSPSISDDGRYVVFQSNAVENELMESFTDSNFDHQSPGIPYPDIFLRDVLLQKTYLISNKNAETTIGAGGEGEGSENPMISGDGRYVVFESMANNLTNASLSNTSVRHLFCRDISDDHLTNPTEPDVVDSKGSPGTAGDENSQNAYISQTGNFIVFESKAINLMTNPPSSPGPPLTSEHIDILLWNKNDKTNIRLMSPIRYIEPGSSLYRFDPTDADCRNPSVSDDGWVVFESSSNQMDFRTVASPPVSQIYLMKWDSGNRPEDPGSGKYDEIISVGAGNIPGINGDSTSPVISPNGRYVTFLSKASNLSDLATGTYQQVFCRDRTEGVTTLISQPTEGSTEANNHQQDPYVTDLGSVVFSSDAWNLVHGDNNYFRDIYFRYRDTKP